MNNPALGAVIAASLMSVAAAQAADIRLLTSWDKTNPAIPLLVESFARNVDAATKGGVKFVINGPETVPPFEQLQPVISGAFQMLFTHAIYHYGTTGIAAGLDALGGTLDARRASGVIEAVDKHYQKLGLKVVALPISATRGYHVVLRAPVNPGGDLQGRKLRGTPSYHGVFAMLGAAAVVLPGGEVYSSLEKGVIDGAAWPANAVLGTRWYEVAKFLLRPAFGVAHQLLLMNVGAWNRLSEGERQAFLREGRRIEELWYREYDRMVDEEERALINDKGMRVTEMGDAQKAKVQQTWAASLWKLAEDKSPQEAKEIRDIARSKGLTY